MKLTDNEVLIEALEYFIKHDCGWEAFVHPSIVEREVTRAQEVLAKLKSNQ